MYTHAADFFDGAKAFEQQDGEAGYAKFLIDNIERCFKPKLFLDAWEEHKERKENVRTGNERS